MNASRTPRLSGTKLALFSALFLLLTGIGLYVVYAGFADRSLGFDVRLLEPTTLAATAALLLVYYLSDGLRLYCTLRALGERVPPKAMARLVFINLFFSNITPMATGGGVAQVWFLRQTGVSVGRATAATTIRTLLAVVFIFGLTPVFLLTLPSLQEHVLIQRIGQALVVFVLLYLGAFTVLLLRTRWLIPPLDGVFNGLRALSLISEARRRHWRFGSRRELLRFSRSFREYATGSPLWVALSVLFTALFLLSLFSFPALLIHALGHTVEYLTSLGLLVVTTFIMYFSPTPGASGVAEGVFGSFFRDLIGGEHLLLVILAWRLVTIYLGMLIGYFILQHGLVQRWRGRS
ncbi:MAG: lysylphosphatidylglycerol synthase transmembrane domain-containing protein [Pseudomonadota bacterium]